MIDRIIIFTGSKRDFQKLLGKEIEEGQEIVPFLEMIQLYNARLRPTEAAYGDNQNAGKKTVEICIVRAEDYTSVLEHALSNFVNIVTLNSNVGTLFVHNPPKRVLMSLVSEYEDIIEYKNSRYQKIDRNKLKKLNGLINRDIVGQEICKKQIITGLYKLTTQKREKPVVLLFYGPSGVGKTETAKSISHALGGELLRIQFSMMQTIEAHNYIFGAEHSKSSFARDLLLRESNIVLIDEFDKVNPNYYNAFYELFDEGKYVDTNYEVGLKNCVFVCTSNFESEEEVKKVLGPAMYSRIGCCIEYAELTGKQKIEIINSSYIEICKLLKIDEKETIDNSNILEWFIQNSDRYDNVRILKTKMENAIYERLAEEFILECN